MPKRTYNYAPGQREAASARARMRNSAGVMRLRRVKLTALCQWCDTVFGRAGTQPAVFCSAHCRTAVMGMLAQARRLRRCLTCNEIVFRSNARYCSPECFHGDPAKLVGHPGRMSVSHGGATYGERTEMLERQSSECALCGRPVAGKSANVHHDHETGRLIAVLCPKCNTGLGFFDDDPILLARALLFAEVA